MSSGNYALAMTTGMVVTLNPCGFAMLPAYLGSFLGRKTSEDEQRSTVAGLARALKVSAAVSLGFMAVFLVIGTLVQLGAKWIINSSATQWLTIVIGVALLAAGFAMLLGHRLPILTPKLEKGGKDGSFQSMFVFGVSYAVASLGCSLGFFVSYTLASATKAGIVSAFVSFIFYSLGFALILTSLTASLALAQGWLLKGLRRFMQYVDRLSAVFMIVAGLYLAWYGYSEVKGSGNAVTRKATGWAGQLTTWIQDQGAYRLAGILGVLVIGALAAVAFRKRTPTT
jgi:cytochrome c-type biogenesis protein